MRFFEFRKYSLSTITFILIFTLVGCEMFNDTKEKSEDINRKTDESNYEVNKNKLILYYINSSNDGIKENILDYNWGKNKKNIDVNYALLKLRQKPKKNDLKASIPKNIIINKVKYYDKFNAVDIDLSSDYYNLKPDREILCRVSIVKTLTQFPFVNSVKLFINGEPLMDSNGKPIGLMHKEDIILNTEDYLLKTDDYKLILYFANEDGTMLKKEIRKIKIGLAESLPKKVISELLLGPKDTLLKSTLPKGTKVRDVLVKDGICYIDFNENFKNNNMESSIGENIIIYSIVNSLTELPNINQVQFLIAGEKQETFKGYIEFQKLFSRNLDIVEK